MTAIGATGTAPNEGGYRAVTRSTAGDPQTSQTDLEQEESQRQAARRKARLYGTPPKNDGSTNVIPFGPTGSTGVQAAAAVVRARREILG